MTEPASRHRPATRWRALVLLVAAAALLAGCELATGTVKTASELQKAGIRNPNLNYDGGTATLEYDADPNPLEARAEQERAAAVIWRNLPFRIEQITVTPDGGASPPESYTRAQLEQRFGPRPADLDRSVGDIARQATLIAGAVALVLLLLIILVIVLVVRAVRRRPAPQPAGAWAQGGAPQPWGRQGWGQPPPPAQPPWNQPAQPGYSQPAPPGQPGYGQPPPGWAQPPPGYGQPPPAAPAAPPRPEAEPPVQGPGDTQRLDPDPPSPPPQGERGPTPPS